MYDVAVIGAGVIGGAIARELMRFELSVCELMPYSGGLTRNIVQCLNDFDIPLYLSHTVTEIHGKDRVTAVTVMKVDENRTPIPGTEMYIPCDTLLLSVGLIPENELTQQAGITMDRITSGAVVDQHRQTSVPGIFACGNVLHVHDLVDFVSDESEIAGISAAEYIKESVLSEDADIEVKPAGLVRYVVPQNITAKEDVKVYFHSQKQKTVFAGYGRNDLS